MTSTLEDVLWSITAILTLISFIILYILRRDAETTRDRGWPNNYAFLDLYILIHALTVTATIIIGNEPFSTAVGLTKDEALVLLVQGNFMFYLMAYAIFLRCSSSRRDGGGCCCCCCTSHGDRGDEESGITESEVGNYGRFHPDQDPPPDYESVTGSSPQNVMTSSSLQNVLTSSSQNVFVIATTSQRRPQQPQRPEDLLREGSPPKYEEVVKNERY